jgi:UDP-N-acetylmuramyl pentapeptide phosphotransferase/UDP-N-acetylglucosamine-1-phosphate transferase
MIYFILFPSFFAIFLIYLNLADHFNIIDKPNERSSHSKITIRGGGIIYLIAALVAVLLHREFLLPVLAFLMIGVISFTDDIITLSSRTRVIFHLAAVCIIFYYLHIFILMPFWLIGLSFVLVIGIINAYNFMDGINGLTGLYSLIVLTGLQYVNYYSIRFVEVDLIWLPILASIVFLFFNFRKEAKCFAGDVGSVTIALWITFLLLTLIIKTGTFAYILFLTVYGIDSVLTILHRLLLRQNIFKPHRLHLYQILANETKISHLAISALYALIQALIIWLVLFSGFSFFSLLIISTVPLIVGYLVLKRHFMFN